MVGAIPLTVRIVSVADIYDTMASERPYHTPRSSSDALQAVQKGAGTHFDPRVLEALASLLATSIGTHLPDVA